MTYNGVTECQQPSGPEAISAEAMVAREKMNETCFVLQERLTAGQAGGIRRK